MNRQLVMAITFAVLSVSCAVTPLLPNIWLLYLSAFVGGACSSVVSSAYTVWLMEIWKGKSNSMLQASELAFGIGSILAPVIMKPFLVGEVDSISAEERKYRLMWPTLITGACMMPSQS